MGFLYFLEIYFLPVSSGLFNRFAHSARRVEEQWHNNIDKRLVSKLRGSVLVVHVDLADTKSPPHPTPRQAGDEICGAVIKIRPHEDNLAVWNKTGSDVNIRKKIKCVPTCFVRSRVARWRGPVQRSLHPLLTLPPPRRRTIEEVLKLDGVACKIEYHEFGEYLPHPLTRAGNNGRAA